MLKKILMTGLAATMVAGFAIAPVSTASAAPMMSHGHMMGHGHMMRHHRHQVCRTVWRHHHRVRVCKWAW